MWIENEGALAVLAYLVQGLGILGVVAARLGTCGWRAVSLIVLCFAIVGVLSASSIASHGTNWLPWATTLPLMAVGATLDLRPATSVNRVAIRPGV